MSMGAEKTPEVSVVECSVSYNKYCSKCGSGIDPATKCCTGCGKQYFKGIPWKVIGRVAPLVILAFSVGLNVYLCLDRSKANQLVGALQSQINELQNTIEEKEESINTLMDTVNDQQTAVNFAKTIAVTLPGEHRFYHKFNGCVVVQSASIFYWNHINLYERDGRTPCPNCWDKAEVDRLKNSHPNMSNLRG